MFSHSVFAANLNVSIDQAVVNQGDVFTATISLNTGDQSINTVEGDLKYNEKNIKIESVNIGNSFVNLWIEKPNAQIPGDIHFSGITPGGIITRDGEIFKVTFRTQIEGDVKLSLDNINLYLNDGKGSPVLAKINNADIKINKEKNLNNTVVALNDKVPPEKFNITRTKDESIFNNNYFIVFSTVDKESGVDHYQVCEFFNCITAESPFLLKDQTPFYYIRVKAYDLNGNYISSTIVSMWLILLIILLIVFVCGLGVYFYVRNL